MDLGNDRTLLLYIYRYKNIFESLCHKKVTYWDTMWLCSSLRFSCCFSSLHLVIRDRFHISYGRTVVAIIATDNQPIYSYSVDGLCSPLFSLYGLLTLLPFEHWCSHFSQDHRVLCRNDFLSSAVWSAYAKSTLCCLDLQEPACSWSWTTPLKSPTRCLYPLEMKQARRRIATSLHPQGKNTTLTTISSPRQAIFLCRATQRKVSMLTKCMTATDLW